MDALVEAKLSECLRYRFMLKPAQCPRVVQQVRVLARMVGHALDDRFAHAGLGAGPEARVAAGLVSIALGGGGWETSDYAIKKEISDWLRTRSPVGY